MKKLKINWHSKYNDRYYYATRKRWDARITANIMKNWNGYNLRFFDENVVQVGNDEKFSKLEIAKLYAECFIAGYFTY
jgi:hypothetical protein